MKKKFYTKSAEETKNLAQKLSQKIGGGWVLYLEGELGAGKTTFAKGVASSLGVATEVTSPTFAIEQLYETKEDLILAHYDFYRIRGKDTVIYEALEKISSNDFLSLVEWGDVLREYLPEKTLYLQFISLSENERSIEIEANSLASKEVLEEL